MLVLGIIPQPDILLQSYGNWRVRTGLLKRDRRSIGWSYQRLYKSHRQLSISHTLSM